MVNNNSLEGVNHVKLVEAIKGEESNSNTPLNQKSTLGGSALGLYQIVDATRKDVYNKYFKENMSKSDFDALYLKDAGFQKTVASKVIDMYLPKSQEQSQKYGIPVEYASTLNYFLGPEGGEAYLKFYSGSGYNHNYAQQKYNDWHLKQHGSVNNNTNIRDYVHKAMNRYYSNIPFPVNKIQPDVKTETKKEEPKKPIPVKVEQKPIPVLVKPKEQIPTIKKAIPKKQNDTKSFFESLEDKIFETYSDVKTAVDQKLSPKTTTNPKLNKINIDYGYKELGTYKDESFRAGKNDSLLSAMNVFDNQKGFDYIVSPKVKEGIKTYKNVKGVAHFIMDGDITNNQKFTSSYNSKDGVVNSKVPGKFINFMPKKDSDYVMYYKNNGDKINVKYGQLKDANKNKDYSYIGVRNVSFDNIDWDKEKSAGFAKSANYISTKDGTPLSLITDPNSKDIYGRFSGGSGIFYFKEPITGKQIAVDISGSINTIKKIGEELSKKYNVSPKDIQFLYHDMGSYSAKPKSHNGVLSNSQWSNYNTNNKGYSGAALMYPMDNN